MVIYDKWVNLIVTWCVCRAGPRREEHGWPEQIMLIASPVRMNPESYDETDNWEEYQVHLRGWPL